VVVQTVTHPRRVCVDIETDDIEAEVRRLEKLEAKRVAQVKRWWMPRGGPPMTVVPAGTFLVGSPADEEGLYEREGLQRPDARRFVGIEDVG
jgi:hypothetical protein